MRLRTTLGAIGAAGIFALAACGGDNGGASGTGNGNGNVSQDTDPAITLAAATESLAEEPFKMEMNLGGLGGVRGAVDPAAGLSEITMEFSEGDVSMTLTMIASETDIWMNMGDLGADLGMAGWMHMDLSRVGGEDLMGISPGADPGNVTAMLETLGDVQRVDDRTFEGVLDLTAATPGAVDEELVEAFGQEATEVAFTATLDDQGRLISMVVTMPDIPELASELSAFEIRYYDHGVPVEITPPSDDEVMPMDEMFYDMFANM